MHDPLPAETIEAAQQGDAAALSALVRHVQDRIHRVALRMLVHPEHAQDATQEILIRIVTKLSTFKGDATFETWAHRVAVNYLLTARKALARDPGFTFDAFADDLMDGLVDEAVKAPEDHVMLNELRVVCTMAILLCLDPAHRMAYVLGEIFEFDQTQASDAMGIPKATFRKRLSRARSEVQAFTASTCGLAGAKNACNCRNRLPAALQKGRIANVPSPYLEDAPSFADVSEDAARLRANLVVAKLQRATGPLKAPKDFAAQVAKIFDPPG